MNRETATSTSSPASRFAPWATRIRRSPARSPIKPRSSCTVSNLYHHEPAGTLADKLAELTGFDSVFFCNSGAEANEAAIKLARKHAFRKGDPNRTTILAAHGSFHGRTFGALAATDNPKYKEGFEPLPLGFAFTPFNDIDALDQRNRRNDGVFSGRTRAGRKRRDARDPRVSRKPRADSATNAARC